MRRFTLHVRLTKRCNADCTYCSSFVAGPGARMSVDEFSRAIEYLASEVMPAIGAGGPGSFLSIEYVGGEVLTVPFADLAAMAMTARDRFGELFTIVRDGAQSNLVSSPAKAAALDTLFGGRVGTSIDRYGSRRRLGGSADAYRAARDASVARLTQRRGRPPGAIFVVDAEGLGTVQQEIEGADRDGHSLVLRPVFSGGSPVDQAALPDLVDTLSRCFDGWAMTSRVAVEPFHHLLGSRLAALAGQSPVAGEIGAPACPFQRECADVSLDLEADGTLHVCVDMADSGQVPLGNALERRFDRDAWEMLRKRKDHIDPKCRECPFFTSCQGGCMSQAIHDTGSPYGRPELCALWSSLFQRIDALVASRGHAEVSQWAGALA